VAIHFPEGSYGQKSTGEKLRQGSLALPKGYIKGAAGAGDAFCSGVLLGVHEEWPLEKCLLTGTCAATAACPTRPAPMVYVLSRNALPWPTSSGSAKMKANFQDLLSLLKKQMTEDSVNNFDLSTRRQALAQLAERKLFPAVRNFVNAHAHTFYSLIIKGIPRVGLFSKPSVRAWRWGALLTLMYWMAWKNFGCKSIT